jgi:glycine cleavage system H protein
MNYPANIKYTNSHEWARLEDGLVVVGISDYAQDALGDVVFVELPGAGKKVKAGDSLAAVESVKTASDIYAPLDGEVVEANAALGDKPELLNQDPYGAGWMFKLKPTNPQDLDSLLDAAAYRSFAESQ